MTVVMALDQRVWKYQKAWLVGLAFLAIAGCWLMVPMSVFSYLAVIGPVAIAIWMWRLSRPVAVLCFLANPAIVLAGLAAMSYFRGAASLHFRGLPGISAYNLDRELRCPRSGGGCLVNGSEWLTLGANNAALRVLGRLFGPMPGAPAGPYPEEDELFAEWPEAEPQSIDDLLGGEVRLRGERIELPAALGQRLPPRHLVWLRILDEVDGFAKEVREQVRPEATDFGGGTFAVRFVEPDLVSERNTVVVLYGGEPAQVMGYFARKTSPAP